MIKVKIVETHLNNNFISDRNKILSEGTFIRAKVSEINGENIVIILDNGESLEARTSLNLENMENQLITFLVKSIEDNKIFLTPINQEDLIIFDNDISKDGVEVFINKVLDTYKLSKNEENKLIIKTILRFKMPLTQENITNVIKNVDKLKELINVQQGDKIYQINSEASTLDESILKLIKVSSNANIDLDTNEDEPKYGNFIPYNKKTNNLISTKDNINFMDFTDIIYIKLKAIYPEHATSMDIINKVAFLMRLGYDVSLRNIEKLTNLIDNREGVIKPLFDLLNYLKNDIENSYSFLNKNIDIFDKANFKLIKVDNNINRENIKAFLREINNLIDKTICTIKAKKNITEELNIKLNDFLESVRLDNKINSYYTFIHIPIEFNDEDNNSNVFILKKKNKLKKYNYSLYISLNTQNLRKVDVFCNISREYIKLDFIVEKEFLVYFKNKFENLRKSLNELGYENIFIGFKEHTKNDILNIFLEDELSNYNLNVRV